MPRHKVTKTECVEALEYFFTEGFMHELTSDKKHYLTILMKQVANKYYIELKGIDDA